VKGEGLPGLRRGGGERPPPLTGSGEVPEEAFLRRLIHSGKDGSMGDGSLLRTGEKGSGRGEREILKRKGKGVIHLKGGRKTLSQVKKKNN